MLKLLRGKELDQACKYNYKVFLKYRKKFKKKRRGEAEEKEKKENYFKRAEWYL